MCTYQDEISEYLYFIISGMYILVLVSLSWFLNCVIYDQARYGESNRFITVFKSVFHTFEAWESAHPYF
jgi:hypothetical protein